MERNNKTIIVFIVIVIIISLIRINRDFEKREKEQHEQEIREANKQLQLWNEYRAAKEHNTDFTKRDNKL